jgi:transcriptional regulator with PAS, ATPase and Fis domain
MKNIIIKVFSDSFDVSSIESAIKLLRAKGFSLKMALHSVSSSPDLEVKDLLLQKESLFIFQINTARSVYFSKIVEISKVNFKDIIVIAPENNALLVSSILKLGITNIFILPFESPNFIFCLEEIIKRISEKMHELSSGKNEVEKIGFSSIIGESFELLKTLNLARKISANSFSNILIRGETGTGKGLLARAIHNESSNSNGRFIEIVCSSIPENLLESELFGYEYGAFTNAQSSKQGLFELAENGSIFLDEVGDLTMNIQKKLLRAIEKKMIRRLGGINDISINARIIAATNMNLEELIERGLFRQDLFHRLNVVSLQIPPLRKRKEDIFPLAYYFIQKFSAQSGKKIIDFDTEVKEWMLSYNWPGNVRELSNLIERAVIISDSKVLTLNDFSILDITNNEKLSEVSTVSVFPNILDIKVNYKETSLKSLQVIYVKNVLKKLGGNKFKTAKLLGISRPKLDSLLKTNKT